MSAGSVTTGSFGSGAKWLPGNGCGDEFLPGTASHSRYAGTGEADPAPTPVCELREGGADGGAKLGVAGAGRRGDRPHDDEVLGDRGDTAFDADRSAHGFHLPRHPR